MTLDHISESISRMKEMALSIANQELESAYQLDLLTELPSSGLAITMADVPDTDEDTEAKEIAEAISLFDKDGDGYLTKDHLFRVMASLGEKPSDTEINELFKEAGTKRKHYYWR